MILGGFGKNTSGQIYKLTEAGDEGVGGLRWSPVSRMLSSRSQHAVSTIRFTKELESLCVGHHNNSGALLRQSGPVLLTVTLAMFRVKDTSVWFT